MGVGREEREEVGNYGGEGTQAGGEGLKGTRGINGGPIFVVDAAGGGDEGGTITVVGLVTIGKRSRER